MESYKVIVQPSAVKEPRPMGCEKLSVQEQYRIRQGDYRIVYEIDDPSRIINVVKVSHRRDVYRRL